MEKHKFKIGDIVVANPSAALGGYSITKPGWKGKVVNLTEKTFTVENPKNHDTYPSVLYKHFDLVRGTKVNFLLKYDLDTDLVEEFETMKEVQERIKELVETKTDLYTDSMVIYEIKAKKLVSVDTRISIKPVK